MKQSLTLIIGDRRFSSWSLRGWLALKHSGLAFDEIRLDLDTDDFHQRIKALSPSKKVPALHHKGHIVWDSLAITDYCARLAPDKFWWPEDIIAYGQARSLVAEMHSGFTALRGAAPMDLQQTWHGLTLSAPVAADVARIDALWQACRAAFGQKGDFLFGDFSAADIHFAPVVTRFLTYDITVSAVARAYMTALRNLDFVDAWYQAAQTEHRVVPATATFLGPVI